MPTDGRRRRARDRGRLPRLLLRPAPRAGEGLISAADVFGLVLALLVFGYLVYALFRGERL